MNSDFRVSVDFFTHHKTKKLKRKLGSDAVICLMSLWAYASKQRTDGNLYDMTAEDIEIAIDWDGEDGAFVEALLNIGFLDQSEEGFSLHDWQENNPWVAEADDRSDKARFSRLAQVNPHEHARLKSEGIVAVNKEDYDRLTNTKRPPAPRSANSGDRPATASASLAPSPAPIPTPTYDSPSMSPPLETPHSMPDKPTCLPKHTDPVRVSSQSELDDTVRCPAKVPPESIQTDEPEEPVPKSKPGQKPPNADETTEADHGKQNRKQQRGTRLAADWQPSLEDWQFAAKNGYTGGEAATAAAKFQDYWHSKAGATAVKLDWSATWRNWIRREIENRGNRGYQRNPEPKPRFNNPFCELIASGESLSEPDGLPDY